MSWKSSDRLGKTGADSAQRRAEEYANNPERTRQLLEDALRKAARWKGRLSEVWEMLMVLIRLVRAWVNGTYKVPRKYLIMAIAALIYFVMPFDIIPDFFLGLGFIDDIAVFAWVVNASRDVLNDFMLWERTRE
jgi:uncharacterized membrane protein YkvA (DUF1232 family)